jgi:hypothetical protein
MFALEGFVMAAGFVAMISVAEGDMMFVELLIIRVYRFGFLSGSPALDK